eukprot:scaffold1112_cov116-Isochrysis_galbana.AAC.38
MVLARRTQSNMNVQFTASVRPAAAASFRSDCVSSSRRCICAMNWFVDGGTDGGARVRVATSLPVLLTPDVMAVSKSPM